MNNQDLDSIKLIESEIKIKLEEVESPEKLSGNACYFRNKQGQVISLCLSNCNIDNVKLNCISSHLKELKYLIELDLVDNQIDDVNSLKDMGDLLGLYLGNNQIFDLRPLKNLNDSLDLFIADNPIKHPPFYVAENGIKAIRDYCNPQESLYEKDKSENLLVSQGEVDGLLRQLDILKFTQKKLPEKDAKSLNASIFYLRNVILDIKERSDALRWATNALDKEFPDNLRMASIEQANNLLANKNIYNFVLNSLVNSKIRHFEVLNLSGGYDKVPYDIDGASFIAHTTGCKIVEKLYLEFKERL